MPRTSANAQSASSISPGIGLLLDAVAPVAACQRSTRVHLVVASVLGTCSSDARAAAAGVPRRQLHRATGSVHNRVVEPRAMLLPVLKSGEAERRAALVNGILDDGGAGGW
jgi:hypothetical protein